ncbi:MAG: YbbR-like domain-containing protein [Treponema sp.]|nr:YbbR-like domain-containing protein [Treponema sp.]
MNTTLLREKMLSNWKEKLICFAMAIAVYAFHQTTKFEKEDFTVPLEVRAPSLLTVKSGFAVPRYVKVSVRASREELGGIPYSDLRAYIDLSSAGPAGTTEKGGFNFTVNVETTSRLSNIFPLEITVQPKTVYVEVEDEIVRYLPVRVNVPGDPPYGYEIDREKISVNPSFIEIKGPKSQVERLEEVQTEAVSLEGVTKTVETEVRYIDPITLEPSSSSQRLAVRVPLVPRISTKDLNIEIVYDNIPPNIDIHDKTPFMTVSFQGEKLVLDDLKAKDFFAEADCSKCIKPGEYKITLDKIPGTTNKKVQAISWKPREITVTAAWKPEEYTIDEPIHNRDNALE